MYALDVQCTIVLVIHDAVMHCGTAICTLAEKSCAPKSSPVTVIPVPPLAATFGFHLSDSTGASNVKIVSDVPITAPTVAAKLNPCPPNGPSKQYSSVPVVHEIVAHGSARPVTVEPETIELAV